MLLPLLLIAIACSGAPTPAPTPDIPAMVAARIQELATPTPYPTYTPEPTGTPYPTYTPEPTGTPYPTYTPVPTATPYPTLGPLPTHTPAPTYTPVPIATPYPTYTPQPTPEPRVETILESDDWTAHPAGEYTAVGTDPSYDSTWVMAVFCSVEGPAVILEKLYVHPFAEVGEVDNLAFLVSFDGQASEQTWTYFPPDAETIGFFSAVWADNVIQRLLMSRQVTVTIPTSEDSYIISFQVEGLDRHMSSPGDLCRG